jgi:hypothetical protein
MSGVIETGLAFAGRESQLDQLHALFAQRRHVLLIGPAGIGKSALLRHFGSGASLLFCKETSRLSQICDGLERQLGCNHPRLTVSERKKRLISYVAKRGQPIVFDHLAHTPPRIAGFIALLTQHVPVWISCRSEMPQYIGHVWECLSDFVHLRLSPLKKSDTRLLIAQAIEKGTIRSDALDHFETLYRMSKGNPWLLKELLIELSTRQYKMATSFRRCLPALEGRMREHTANLASQAVRPNLT